MPSPDTTPAAGTLPATLLTIADFGDVRNLKTEESEAILQGLRRIDPDTRLLCRDSKRHDYRHSRRVIPFGALLPKIATAACRLVGARPRPLVKHLLDTFAARKIDRACLLVTVPKGYPKTLRKNRELGGVNVCYEAFAATNYHWPDDTYATGEDPMLALYDHFLLISSLARETYLRQGVAAERLHLVHMGVDAGKYRPGEAGDATFRVLCMGNEPDRKGFGTAIEAWNELDLPDAELRVVGNDVVRSFEGRAGPSVVLAGFSDAAAEMRAADLLLHPAVFEPFGKIVTEAMASGLPVVISERTGAKDLVVEGVNGSVIPANDKEAIKRAILWHHRNRAASVSMGVAAREHILASCGWDDFSDRVADALGRIAGTEAGR